MPFPWSRVKCKPFKMKPVFRPKESWYKALKLKVTEFIKRGLAKRGFLIDIYVWWLAKLLRPTKKSRSRSLGDVLNAFVLIKRFVNASLLWIRVTNKSNESRRKSFKRNFRLVYGLKTRDNWDGDLVVWDSDGKWEKSKIVSTRLVVLKTSLNL